MNGTEETKVTVGGSQQCLRSLSAELPKAGACNQLADCSNRSPQVESISSQVILEQLFSTIKPPIPLIQQLANSLPLELNKTQPAQQLNNQPARSDSARAMGSLGQIIAARPASRKQPINSHKQCPNIWINSPKHPVSSIKPRQLI